MPDNIFYFFQLMKFSANLSTLVRVFVGCPLLSHFSNCQQRRNHEEILDTKGEIDKKATSPYPQLFWVVLLFVILPLLVLYHHLWGWGYFSNHTKYILVVLISVLSPFRLYKRLNKLVSVFDLRKLITTSEKSTLIIHPSISMELTLMQNPCETMKNAVTTYEIDGSRLIERTGIFCTQHQEINLSHIVEKPHTQRRLKHLLLDIFKTIVGESPLLLADIYVYQSVKRNKCIILKSVAHAHTVAKAIYSKGQ